MLHKANVILSQLIFHPEEFNLRRMHINNVKIRYIYRWKSIRERKKREIFSGKEKPETHSIKTYHHHHYKISSIEIFSLIKLFSFSCFFFLFLKLKISSAGKFLSIFVKHFWEKNPKFIAAWKIEPLPPSIYPHQ